MRASSTRCSASTPWRRRVERYPVSGACVVDDFCWTAEVGLGRDGWVCASAHRVGWAHNPGMGVTMVPIGAQFGLVTQGWGYP
eukprot:316190-Prymnesium_polylepis.1